MTTVVFLCVLSYHSCEFLPISFATMEECIRAGRSLAAVNDDKNVLRGSPQFRCYEIKR